METLECQGLATPQSVILNYAHQRPDGARRLGRPRHYRHIGMLARLVTRAIPAPGGPLLSPTAMQRERVYLNGSFRVVQEERGSSGGQKFQTVLACDGRGFVRGFSSGGACIKRRHLRDHGIEDTAR